jgi:hypothetical protein
MARENGNVWGKKLFQKLKFWNSFIPILTFEAFPKLQLLGKQP